MQKYIERIIEKNDDTFLGQISVINKNHILSFLLYLSLLPIFISQTIFANDAEVIQLDKTTSEKSKSSTGINLEKAQFAEALWLGQGEDVSISTRQETPISKAPSIITVITDEEIKNLGYRTFVEILRTVPGFEILKRGDYGTVVPVVRGVEGANKIRVMLNGHFVNYPLWGDAFMYFDDFPVESIKRLEIIRGPGSAMYGENAFLATINIITKDAKDVDGVKVSSGYGSFNTYDENVVFGERRGDVEISGMAHYRQTNGFEGTIQSDAQTINDNKLKTSASEAPGRVEDWRQEYDLDLRVTWKGFYVEGFYQDKHHSPFLGPSYVLNDESNVMLTYVFCEAGYKKTFDDRLTLKPRVYYDQFDRDGLFELYPENTAIDTNKNGKADSGEFHPNGIVGRTIVSERVAGTEIPVDYELFDRNLLTLGVEYRLINQGNMQYFANYNPITLEDLGSMQNLTDTYPFIKDVTRRIESAYLQDVWDVTDTMNLTAGVRHDQYSDFGGTTNPRVGLTWAFIENASLKLLYGTAFRAPNFREMFTTNNPAIQGNENLDPETIRTYEAGLNYHFNKYVTSGINYFYNDIKDLIVIRTPIPPETTSQYENFGNAHVQGVEMETRVNIKNDNYVFMNYTYQNPKDNHGNDLPFVAEHYGNFGVNVHYWEYVNTNLSTFVSGSRSRVDGDSRDKLPAYELLNLSIVGKGFFKTVEVQGTIFNLLNKDYNDPGPSLIHDDIPRPGRTFFTGLSYKF